MSNGIKNKATEYLKTGLSVIPTKEDKLPALNTWKLYQTERIKIEEVERLFSRGDVKGLAIICGAISGSLEVIDVDTKHDTTGSLWEELRTLIEDNLPELYSRLVIAQTKSGGYHIYYRCSSIAGNLKLSTKLNKEVLIETRGEGGYVIAPPTPKYTYIQGEPGNIPTITPEEREILFYICKSFNELEEIKPKVNTTSSTYNSTGLSPFEDYNQRGDIVGLLESKGWRVVNQRGERINLLRPGSTDSKTSGNYHTGLKVLRVFSSSTEFNPDKGYSPSQVFSLLECNEDNKLTYRRLLELGYGEPYKAEDIKPTQVKTERIKVEIVNSVNRESSVISTPGESLKIENIQTAIGEEVVITSPGEEAQEEVLKTIELILQTGKRIYIKEGSTEFREFRYQLRAIFNKYGTIQEESGGLTDRDRDRLLEEVLIVSKSLQPIDKDIFLKEFLELEAIQELGITEESLSITVDRLTSTRDKEAQAKALKKLLSEVATLHDKGETDKALELLQEESNNINLLKNKDFVSEILKATSRKDILEEIRTAPEGLKSGYYLGKVKNGILNYPDEWIITAGGLTAIAGATNHGKTDFLINTCLQVSKNYPEKKFIYLTYEQSRRDIFLRFLNSFCNIDITDRTNTKSNIRAIRDFYRNTEKTSIEIEQFKKKEEEFYTKYIDPQRIIIKQIDYNSEEINSAIYNLCKHDSTIGGFFIDYYQKLELPQKERKEEGGRVEELKTIGRRLNALAIKTKIPIVLGAQFNRKVMSSEDMFAQNIGEAGDIERIVDTLLAIWNTNKKLRKHESEEAYNLIEKGIAEEIETDRKDKNNKPIKKLVGIPNRLYIEVLKSRDTETGLEALLEYNGKLGKIENSNSSESSYF